jgi:energy-converting hydrogenase Eha subunit E
MILNLFGFCSLGFLKLNGVRELASLGWCLKFDAYAQQLTIQLFIHFQNVEYQLLIRIYVQECSMSGIP